MRHAERRCGRSSSSYSPQPPRQHRRAPAHTIAGAIGLDRLVRSIGERSAAARAQYPSRMRRRSPSQCAAQPRRPLPRPTSTYGQCLRGIDATWRPLAAVCRHRPLRRPKSSPIPTAPGRLRRRRPKSRRARPSARLAADRREGLRRLRLLRQAVHPEGRARRPSRLIRRRDRCRRPISAGMTTDPIPAASSTAPTASIPTPRSRLTADALKGCDDGELYLQYTASESFGFDDGRLKTADFNTQAGFGLRGVSGETTAFAQANELSEAAIRRAAETMAVLDPAKGAAAPPPRRTNAKLYTDADPLEPDPVRRQGRALPGDRRRRPRPRSARRPGLGRPRRLVERDRHRPRPTASSPTTSGRWCGSTSRSSSSRTAAAKPAITASAAAISTTRCSSRRPGTGRSTSRSPRRW